MFARLFAFFLLLPGIAVAAGFLSVVEDLPLAPGLTEVVGSAFSFDSQDGRIVEAEAKGHADTNTILKFYTSALPQLGWTQDSPNQFHRDQDILRLETTELGKGILSIKFKVSPK